MKTKTYDEHGIERDLKKDHRKGIFLVTFPIKLGLLDPYSIESTIWTRLVSLSKVHSFGSVPV